MRVARPNQRSRYCRCNHYRQVANSEVVLGGAGVAPLLTLIQSLAATRRGALAW